MIDNRRCILLAGVLLVAGGCSEPSVRNDFQPSPSRPISLSDTSVSEPNTPVGHYLAEDASLRDYIDYAAANSPALAAAFDRWQAETKRSPQVTALPDPTLSYTNLWKPRAMPQRHIFELSQAFPWFGKLDLQGEAATAGALAEQRNYEAVRFKLAYDVKTAYFEYYYLARSIASVQEDVNLVRSFESDARVRYQASESAYADVIRAQVELATLANQLKSLQDLRSSAAARLNAAMNRPVQAVLPWPSGIPEQPVAMDDAELHRLMRQNSPELLAAQAQVEKSRSQISLASKQYYPDFTLSIQGADASGTDTSPHEDVYGASVMVTLPIWRQKLAAGVDESYSRHQAAVADKLDRYNTLGADLKMAAYQYRDGMRRVVLYRDVLVPKQAESIKALQRSYQASGGTFLDLIEAERTLLEFKLSLYRALADQATGLARIEMLIGKEM